MVWWMLKKRGNNELSHEAIKGSFSNIKKDMNHLGKWVNHFKDKHGSHEKNQKEILERLDKLEALLALQQTSNLEANEADSVEGLNEDLPKADPHECLSYAEKRVCEKLAGLQEGREDSWVPIKKLALEVYPDKEYKDSRSPMSQILSKLEKKGYIAKRKTKKYAYVYLQKEQDLFLRRLKRVPEKKKKKQK